MSVYRIHFSWKGKEVTLSARSLDMTHPYFVSIKDLVFREEKRLLIDPSEDEIRKTFGESTHLMIPFQTVSLIEEVEERPETRVRSFSLVEEEEDNSEPEDG